MGASGTCKKFVKINLHPLPAGGRVRVAAQAQIGRESNWADSGHRHDWPERRHVHPDTSVTFLAQDRGCNREPKRFLRENYDGVKMADGRWRTIGVTSTYEAGPGLRAFRPFVVFCAGLVVLAHFSASAQVLSYSTYLAKDFNAGSFALNGPVSRAFSQVLS
jgi:hypothetical protein